MDYREHPKLGPTLGSDPESPEEDFENWLKQRRRKGDYDYEILMGL